VFDLERGVIASLRFHECKGEGKWQAKAKSYMAEGEYLPGQA
jgi:hypothetical protein